jgi:hypothetical protein
VTGISGHQFSMRRLATELFELIGACLPCEWLPGQGTTVILHSAHNEGPPIDEEVVVSARKWLVSL